MERVGVIGAGSWGTTLANMLAQKGYRVHLWVREEEVYRQIKEDGINHTFLPGMKLTPRLRPVQSFEEALRHKDIVLLVVPSHVFREVLAAIRSYLGREICIVSATKGIENDSLQVMSQVAESILPGECLRRFTCIAGPSFAKEVFAKYPTAVTIAGHNVSLTEKLQTIFSTEYFRVYTSQDLLGVQLCGAVKNVIAIAAGASDGLNFGHNARAALITRGLAEIARLGARMGANPMTFAGLAGMGDLVLTCTGDLSRNRTVGLKIGKGMKLDHITAGMSMVAEGIRTTKSVYELAKKMNVEMPICTQVYEIIYEGKDPRVAVKDLMGRALKRELEDRD